jgi:concanavalin A-like lectin/glucanase superfamily protein
MTLTTRASIPHPVATDAADVPSDMTAMANAIDAILPIWLSGLASGRPAASKNGRFYWATDTLLLSYDNGSVWTSINAADLAAAVASQRTLGTGSTQAAAGNDSRLSDQRVPTNGSVTNAKMAAAAVAWANLLSATMAYAQVGSNGAANTRANVRAGRQLARTDFTTLLGLSEPKLLLNLSAAVDSSVNGLTFQNNGSITFTEYGVEGVANTAIQLNGINQYVATSNTVKQKYGTWGGWFKVGTQTVEKFLMGMWTNLSSDNSAKLICTTDGYAQAVVSTGGGSLVGHLSKGSTRIDDDKWHFINMTWDGMKLCLYVDGVLDASETMSMGSGTTYGGPANQSATMFFTVGAEGGGTKFLLGSVDEVFVTPDVLTEEQLRFLYCKKIAHALATVPEHFTLNVKKYTRSKAYTSTSFTSLGSVAQPLTASIMEAATWVDYGSLAKAMTLSNVSTDVPGPEGNTGSKAWYFNGAASVIGTDTGLPSGAATGFTLGFWIQARPNPNATRTVLAWGTSAGNAGRQIDIDANGNLVCWNTGGAGQQVAAFGIADGEWHNVVWIEEPGASSGFTRRLYVDGILVSVATGAIPSITLSGANGFRIGQNLSAAQSFVGNLGGVWIESGQLTGAVIRDLYNTQGQLKNDQQPHNPFNHIERVDTSNVYAIFDQLEEVDMVQMMLV